MLVGLSIGLAVALVVYLQSGRLPNAEPGPSARLREPAPQPADEPLRRLPAPTPGTAESAPRNAASAQSAAGDAGLSGPAARAAGPARFEFYESLADFEVVVPQSIAEQRAAPRPTTTDAPPAVDVEGTRGFMIQAGSFRAVADADSRKANLAMLGIESELRRVNLGDGVYHRVMIGPISEAAEYNRITRRLADANIESLTLALGE